jgi:hypothetical protein
MLNRLRSLAIKPVGNFPDRGQVTLYCFVDQRIGNLDQFFSVGAGAMEHATERTSKRLASCRVVVAYRCAHCFAGN